MNDKHAIKAVRDGKIFGGMVDCYVLENGERLISQRGAVRALTSGNTEENGGAGTGDLGRYLARLPGKFSKLGLAPTVEFQPPVGAPAKGITPQQFLDILDAYVDAFMSGQLKHPGQIRLAQNARALSKGLTLIGLNALIDEATGFQEVREANRLARDLERFLKWEAGEWQLTWKRDFALPLSRLYRLRKPWNGRGSQPAPLAEGYQYIYRCVLGDDIYRRLKERNPTPHQGSAHHQYLADMFADKFRKEDILVINVILKQSRNLKQFKNMLALHYGRDIQQTLVH